MSTKITGSKIRPGQTLEIDEKLWKVLETVHVKPGKGGAFTKAKIQSAGGVGNQITKEVQFSSSEDVYLAQTEDKTVKYLYEQNDECFFMDSEYVIYSLPSNRIGEMAKLLTPEVELTLALHNEEVIDVVLPIRLQCKIDETTPSASGGSLKHAISNGIRFSVPSYIQIGDQVVVDSRDKTFVEKVK